MADERARALRRRMTRQEVRLWLRLRALRPQGYHFRRQVPANPYIRDFARLRARLVIDVDGEHHGLAAQRRHDERRDATLVASGFTVLRFWNHEIDTNIEGVVDTVLAAARPALDDYAAKAPRRRSPHPSRPSAEPPSPHGEGAAHDARYPKTLA